MIESLFFTYDGITSEEMGVIQINTGSGLFDEHYLPSANIVEEKVPGNSVPHYIRTEWEPITLPFSILFKNELNDEEARKIGRWLNQDYYKPLIFSTHPHKIYYAKFTGNPRLFHNGCMQGYATLEMRCNAPWAYSPVYVSQIYDLSTNSTGGTEVVLENHGDFDIAPIIYIEKIGNGDISIVNTSDGGKNLELIGLTNLEKLTIDCETEEIETDLPGIYRYDSHNDVFLSIPRGANRIKIFGACKLQFKYEFKFL